MAKAYSPAMQCPRHPAEKLTLLCGQQGCQNYMRLACRLCVRAQHQDHSRNVVGVEQLKNSLKCFLQQKESSLPDQPNFKNDLRGRILLFKEFKSKLECEVGKLELAESCYDDCSQELQKARDLLRRLRIIHRKMQNSQQPSDLEALLSSLSQAMKFGAQGECRLISGGEQAFQQLVSILRQAEEEAKESFTRSEQFVQKVLDVLASNDFSLVEEQEWVASHKNIARRRVSLQQSAVLEETVQSASRVDYDAVIKDLQIQVEEAKKALKSLEATMQINQYDHQIMLKKLREFKAKYEQAQKALAQLQKKEAGHAGTQTGEAEQCQSKEQEEFNATRSWFFRQPPGLDQTRNAWLGRRK